MYQNNYSVKVSEEDPTVVRITRYTNFVEGETYYFEYGDSKPVEFKIATNKLAEVDTIKLVVADHYYVGKTTPIVIKYFNKDGVELAVADQAAPTIDINSEVAFPDGDGIWFTAEGKATIKATVIIDYNEDTFAPIERTDSIEVTGIQETAVPATSVDYSFGAEASKNIHYIRLKAPEADLNATFKDANGKTLATYTSGDANYYLKSTSEDIVQIAAGNKVTGVNVGSAVILLCYTEDGKEQVSKAFPIEVKEANKATTNVTATIDKNTLNVNDIATATSGVDINDKITLKVKVLDLDGIAYAKTALTYTIKQVANNATSVGVDLDSSVAKEYANEDGEFEVVFNKGNVLPDAVNYANSTFAKNGTGRVAFELTVKEGSTTLATKTFSFVVADIDPIAPGTGVTVGYKLNASNTALDISRKNFKDSIENLDNALITVQKTGTKNQNQFYLGTTTCKVIKSLNDIPVSVATNTSINYVVATTPYTAANNIVHPNTGDMYDFNAFANKVSVENLHDINVVNFVDEDAATADDVAKAGTYSFVGVRVNYNTADTANPGNFKQTGQRINIGTVNVVVSGTDEKATFTEKADLSAAVLQDIIDGTNYLGKTLNDCYKVTWDGINSDDTSTENGGRVTFVLGDYKSDKTTKSVYVYKLTVTIKPYQNGTGDMVFTQDIAINKLYKDK